MIGFDESMIRNNGYRIRDEGMIPADYKFEYDKTLAIDQGSDL